MTPIRTAYAAIVSIRPLLGTAFAQNQPAGDRQTTNGRQRTVEHCTSDWLTLYH